jgi:hypothetical protein
VFFFPSARDGSDRLSIGLAKYTFLRLVSLWSLWRSDTSADLIQSLQSLCRGATFGELLDGPFLMTSVSLNASIIVSTRQCQHTATAT